MTPTARESAALTLLVELLSGSPSPEALGVALLERDVMLAPTELEQLYWSTVELAPMGVAALVESWAPELDLAQRLVEGLSGTPGGPEAGGWLVSLAANEGGETPVEPDALAPEEPGALAPEEPDALAPEEPDALAPEEPDAPDPEKPEDDEAALAEFDEWLEAYEDEDDPEAPLGFDGHAGDEGDEEGEGGDDDGQADDEDEDPFAGLDEIPEEFEEDDDGGLGDPGDPVDLDEWLEDDGEEADDEDVDGEDSSSAGDEAEDGAEQPEVEEEDTDDCAQLSAAANALQRTLEQLHEQATSIVARLQRLHAQIQRWFEEQRVSYPAPDWEKLEEIFKAYSKAKKQLEEEGEYGEWLEARKALDESIDRRRKQGATEAELEAEFGARDRRLTEIYEAEFKKTIDKLNEQREKILEYEKAIARIRKTWCESGDCDEYNAEYARLRGEYDVVRRTWERVKVAWDAAVKACSERNCPYAKATVPFPEFPPNLCERLCKRGGSTEEEGFEGGLSLEFEESLIEIFGDEPKPDSGSTTDEATEGDDPRDAPPPECWECLEFYRRYVAKAAEFHQKALDALHDKLFRDLLDRHAAFHRKYGPQIAELSAEIRAADARVRALTCDVVEDDEGNKYVTRVPGGEQAAVASKRRKTAARRLRRIASRLDDINARIGPAKRKLERRYDKALERVTERYEGFLRRCAACDPGRPALVKRFLFIEPETVDIPPPFDGNCHDLSNFGVGPNGSPDEPDKRPDGHGEDPPPLPEGRGQEPPPDPPPEEEIVEQIDILLAFGLPCQLDTASIVALRDRIRALVTERKVLKAKLESEQARLLNVLAVAEAKTKAAEATFRSAERDFERLERDSRVGRRMPGVQYSAANSYWNSWAGKREMEAHYDSLTRLYGILEEAFENWELAHEVYREAHEDYTKFVNGALAQGRRDYTAKATEINQLLDRLEQMLEKCGDEADTGKIDEPWDPNEDAPDAVEGPTKGTVEELEKRQADNRERARKQRAVIDGLDALGPLGRALRRVIAADEAIEGARRKVQMRIDEIRRERGQGPEEQQDIAAILAAMERELAPLRRRRAAAMRQLAELQLRMASDWNDVMGRAEREFAAAKEAIDSLERRAASWRHDNPQRMHKMLERAKRARAELRQRMDRARERARSLLGAENFPLETLDEDALALAVRRARDAGIELRKLDRQHEARARSLERIRHGALPRMDELFESDPQMAGAEGALAKLLKSVAMPDAHVGQRKEAPRKVLAPKVDVARATLQLKRLMIPATDAGVDGDLVGEFLRCGTEPVHRQLLLLRRLLAEGLGQDEKSRDLFMTAARVLARGVLDGVPRAPTRVAPEGVTEAQWREWIGMADLEVLLGLLVMRPPSALGDAFAGRLRQLLTTPPVDKAGTLRAVARQLLRAMAHAGAARAEWHNGFEEVIRVLDPPSRNHLAGLLDMYEAGLPQIGLDGLDSLALIRRLDQADSWGAWRKLFARAAARSELRELPELFRRAADVSAGLQGLDEDDLAAARARLGTMLAARLSELRGSGSEWREWLALLDDQERTPLAAGVRALLRFRAAEALEDTDLTDVDVVRELVQRAMAEGADGPLHALEVLLRAPSRLVMDELMRRVRAEAGGAMPPLEILAALLEHTPVNEEIVAGLYRGLADPALREPLRELLRGWVDGVDAPEASDRLTALLSLIERPMDAAGAEIVLEAIAAVPPGRWKPWLDRAILDPAQRERARRLVWALGEAGLTHVILELERDDLDAEVREWIIEHFLAEESLVFKPAEVSWEKLAKWVYEDERYATPLRWHQRRPALEGASGCWLRLPKGHELASEMWQLGTLWARQAQDRFAGVELSGLPEAQRRHMQALRRRLGILRGSVETDPFNRFEQLRKLADGLERIITALELQTTFRAFYERGGTPDADRQKFLRFQARVTEAIRQFGAPEVHAEVVNLARWLERMMAMSRTRSELERTARTILLRHRRERYRYSYNKPARQAGLARLRELDRAVRRSRRSERYLDSMALVLAAAVRELDATDPRRVELAAAFEAVKATLTPGVQNGSHEVTDADGARAAARRLFVAWRALAGFLPELLARGERALKDTTSPGGLFELMNQIADAHYRLTEEAGRHLDRLDAAREALGKDQFDISAFGQYMERRQARWAAKKPEVKRQLERRNEIGKGLQPFLVPKDQGGVDTDSEVTAAHLAGLRRAQARVADELEELRQLVAAQEAAIARDNQLLAADGKATHRADFGGVRQALRSAAQLLSQAETLRRRGSPIRAARAVLEALDEIGIASHGINAEVQMYTAFRNILAIQAYFAQQTFETERSRDELRRLTALGRAVIDDFHRVRLALIAGGSIEERKRIVEDAALGTSRLLRLSHEASVRHIEFVHSVEAGAKTLLALAAATLTLGLLAPFTEVMIARVATWGLQAMRVSSALGTTIRYAGSLGQLAWETTVFTGVNNTAQSLLNGDGLPSEPLAHFWKNLLLFGGLRPVAAANQALLSGMSEGLAKATLNFAAEVPVFVLVGALERVVHNARNDVAWGHGWTWMGLLRESVLALGVMKLSAAVGRHLLHESVMQRFAGARDAVALRVRELDAQLGRIREQHKSVTDRLRQLSRENASPEKGEMQRLHDQLVGMLGRKASVALELAQMGLVPKAVADELHEAATTANARVTESVELGRRLVEELGLRQASDGVFTVAPGKHAELVRLLRQQGHVAEADASGLVFARMGQRTVLFRPRSPTTLRLRSRGELLTQIAQLRLEGAIGAQLRARPGTYRIRMADGEIVLVEVRPRETEHGQPELNLPVAEPAGRRADTDFRIARIQPRSGRDQVVIRDTGQGLVVESGNLPELLRQMLVARELGHGVDLIVLPEKTIRVEMPEGASMKATELMRHPVVEQLAAFARTHGLSLILGIRFHRGRTDVNGAVALTPGRPPRFVRDTAHFEALEAGQIARDTTIEMGGMRLRVSVCADTQHVRGDSGDGHIVVASARRSVEAGFLRLIPDAVVVNWASPRMSASQGISYRDLPHPSRTLAELMRETPPGRREALRSRLDQIRTRFGERAAFLAAQRQLQHLRGRGEALPPIERLGLIGAVEGVGRVRETFDLHTRFELGDRVQTPEHLLEPVREGQIPDLRAHLASEGIEIVFATTSPGHRAGAKVDFSGATARIELNPRSTWLDLANELYKVDLARALDITNRPFTTELRAFIEAKSFQFERRLLAGTRLRGRLARAAGMGAYWRGVLARVRSGREANMIESQPGEPITLFAGGKLTRSMRQRVAALNRRLGLARLGSGALSGRYDGETLELLQALTDRALERLERRDRARTQLEDAWRALGEATTEVARERAWRDIQRAGRRVRAAERAASERMRLIVDTLAYQSGDPLLIRGLTRTHAHPEGAFQALVTEYNAVVQQMRFAFARSGQLARQGRLLSSITALIEARALQQRRNRISESLGEQGARFAFEALFGRPDTVLWPDPMVQRIIGRGRLDSVVRVGDEIWVIEEKGGSSTVRDAGYNGVRTWQGSLAHTLATATRMRLAADRIRSDPNSTPEDLRLARRMQVSSALVIRAYRTGKLRVFVASTPWVRDAAGRVVGAGPTEVTEALIHRPRQVPPPRPIERDAIDRIRELFHAR